MWQTYSPDSQASSSMSSDLARSIHTIAKHLHAAEQKRLAEHSAAVLHIRHEEEGDFPDEWNDHYDKWEIHKTTNGTVQLYPANPDPERTSGQAAYAEGYKFHTYNQAVGKYLAGHFLFYEGEAPHGVILIYIRRNESTARTALHLRCTAETLPRSIHAIMQAYLAGSFV